MEILCLAHALHVYDQIAIFVQKNNDLDTCACACALAEIINDNFGDKKNVSILGLYGTSKFLPENKKYKNKPIDWEKNTLVILSEITSVRQIDKHHLNNIFKANQVIILDHHPENEEEYKELWKNFKLENEPLIIRDTEQTSVCEVLWNSLMRNPEDFSLSVSKRTAEILFMGLYSDTKNLTSESVSANTYNNITGMVGEFKIDTGKLINELNHKPIANLKLFAETVRDSEQIGKLLFLSLNPRHVKQLMPRLLIKGKGGSLRQKSMLTYIPRGVEQYADVNTIVFLHYSLYEPYNAQKKYVYVILVKPNPAIERILEEYQFKKNRNRWSREMKLENILDLVERYKEIFTC